MALDPSMPVLVVDDYATMVRITRNLLQQSALRMSTTPMTAARRSPRCTKSATAS
jgi:hypothetical protein